MTTLEIPTRIPPHHLEAERAVLGAILLEGAGALQQLGALEPDDFYLEADRVIFGVMLGLAGAGEPIDLLLVADALRRRDELDLVGGPAYLAYVEQDASIRMHLARYAAIVRRAATLRALIATSTSILTQAADDTDDVQLIVDQALGRVEAIAKRAAVAESPFQALPLAALIALDIPEPVFVVAKWISAEGLNFVVGDSEAYKSWFTLYLAVCVAAGRPLFDLFPVRQSPTLVISEENGIAEDRMRADKVCRGMGFDPSTTPCHIASDSAFSFDEPAKYASMRAYVAAHGIRLVVIDSFIRVHRRKEQDSGEMNALYQDRMKPLVRAGVALVLLHHKRKAAQGALPATPNDNDDIRGSGDIRAASHAVLFLKSVGDGKVIVKHNKGRGGGSRKQEPYVFELRDVDSGGVELVHRGKPADVVDKKSQCRTDVLAWAFERGSGLPFVREDLVRQFKGTYGWKVLNPVLKELSDGGYPLKKDKVKGQRAAFYQLVPNAAQEDVMDAVAGGGDDGDDEPPF